MIWISEHDMQELPVTNLRPSRGPYPAYATPIRSRSLVVLLNIN